MLRGLAFSVCLLTVGTVSSAAAEPRDSAEPFCPYVKLMKADGIDSCLLNPSNTDAAIRNVIILDFDPPQVLLLNNIPGVGSCNVSSVPFNCVEFRSSEALDFRALCSLGGETPFTRCPTTKILREEGETQQSLLSLASILRHNDHSAYQIGELTFFFGSPFGSMRQVRLVNSVSQTEYFDIPVQHANNDYLALIAKQINRSGVRLDEILGLGREGMLYLRRSGKEYLLPPESNCPTACEKLPLLSQLDFERKLAAANAALAIEDLVDTSAEQFREGLIHATLWSGVNVESVEKFKARHKVLQSPELLLIQRK